MAIGSVVFAGLLAMAPNWAIVDIPYPEAGGGMEASSAPTPEARVIEALTAYARGRSLKLRKGDIADIKVKGARATAAINSIGVWVISTRRCNGSFYCLKRCAPV